MKKNFTIAKKVDDTQISEKLHHQIVFSSFLGNFFFG